MPRYESIQDEQVRSLLAEATASVRGGDATTAVKKSAEAFLRLIDLTPELLQKNLPADNLVHHQQFPRMGANLYENGGKAEIRYERERFSTSEAFAYMEYTIETALREQKAKAGA